jgi:hypothetical protein
LRCFFSGDHRANREHVLTALKGALEGVVGSPVRLHDAQFLDLPLADFFASDPDGRLFAVRWIEGRELASRLFEMLAGFARLQVSGRSALASALGLPADFPSLTLILVSDAVGDAWADVASTLNIPIVGLRVHLLVDGAGDFAGCYFETRFATGGGVMGSGAAVLGEPSRARGETPSPAEPQSARGVSPRSEPVARPALSSRQPATPDPPPRHLENAPPGVASGREDFDDPAARLTDEEAASFRLLEGVLASKS